MRALVTGGCGFIGTNLALGLEREGHDVTLLDRRTSHPLLELFGGTVTTGDAADLDTAMLRDFDVVFHEAGLMDTTVHDKELMWADNVDPFGPLLDAASAAGTDVIYASSAAVYGNSPGPHRVGHGEEPLNVYGASKLAADAIARERIGDGCPMKIIGLRYFNVFGPGESHKEHMASMITKLGAGMLAGTRPKIFWDGEQRRDHLYIADAVRANVLAFAAPREASGVYNVGTGTAVSFNEIITILNASLGTDFEPEYIANPHAGYQNHTEADITDTAATLGYAPAFDVASAVQDYFGASP